MLLVGEDNVSFAKFTQDVIVAHCPAADITRQGRTPKIFPRFFLAEVFVTHPSLRITFGDHIFRDVVCTYVPK